MIVKISCPLWNPPEWDEEVFNKVMEQVEFFKSYSDL